MIRAVKLKQAQAGEDGSARYCWVVVNEVVMVGHDYKGVTTLKFKCGGLMDVAGTIDEVSEMLWGPSLKRLSPPKEEQE